MRHSMTRPSYVPRNMSVGPRLFESPSDSKYSRFVTTATPWLTQNARARPYSLMRTNHQTLEQILQENVPSIQNLSSLVHSISRLLSSHYRLRLASCWNMQSINFIALTLLHHRLWLIPYSFYARHCSGISIIITIIYNNIPIFILYT